MQSILENKKKIEKSFIPKFDNPYHSSQYILTVPFYCYPFLNDSLKMLTKWSLIWDCKTGYSKKYFYEEQPQVPKEFTGGLDKLC